MPGDGHAFEWPGHPINCVTGVGHLRRLTAAGGMTAVVAKRTAGIRWADTT